MDNLQTVQNMRNEIEQLKADRLEMAEAVVSALIQPYWVIEKALQIIKESK